MEMPTVKFWIRDVGFCIRNTEPFYRNPLHSEEQVPCSDM